MYTSIKLKNPPLDSTTLSIYHNVTRILAMRYAKGYGVKRVTVYKNETPFTMQYIINRLEQIPFKTTGTFRGQSSGNIILSDIFHTSAVYTDILLLKHEKFMELDVEVQVIQNEGLIHSKYSPIQSMWYDHSVNLNIVMLDYKTLEQLKQDIKLGLEK